MQAESGGTEGTHNYDPCTIIIPTLICTVWETDL